MTRGLRRAALLATAGAAGLAAHPACAASLWVDAPLADVEVMGLSRTRPHVVERELRLRPGDRVRWDRVEADRLRLLDLGLFADARTSVRRDPATNRPILAYSLRERPTWALLPILEYDPDEGVAYGIYFAERNWRGRAERIGASATWGDRKGAALSYAAPWVAGRRLGLATSVFLSDRENQTERTRERKHGFAWTLSPARDYERRAALFGGVEEARTRPVEAADPGAPPREREDHRWLGLQVSLDTRDYRVQARHGVVLRASATQHGGALGGDADFVRYGADLLCLLPTPGGTAFTVATRAQISDGPVPSYLRQNLGGINTLRGHPQGAYGGESRWIGWVEERVPLMQRRTFQMAGRTVDFALDLVVFADVGTIWDRNELLEGRAESRWGGGAGLRCIVPWVDLVRIDAATDGDRIEVYAASGLRL